MLEFWEQQGIMADDAHMLRLEWAKGSLPEWKVGLQLNARFVSGCLSGR